MTFYCGSSICSVIRYVSSTLSGMFDRANPAVKSTHDLVFNVAVFAAAVYAMHKWGHKLAV